MRTLLEIYNSHPNWLEDEEHPHCQKEEVIHTEMYEEADQYVKELTTIPHNWKNVLMHDVSRMNPYDRVTRYWLYDVWKELEEYLDITYDCNDGGLSDNEYKYLMHIELVEYFLDTVQGAIYRYFGEDINLVEYLRQEAIDEEKQTADTSTPEQTPLDKLLEQWNAPGIKKRVLIQLEKNGLATKNGKVYNWKIDNDNDYPNKLYVYFVYIASDKFGWRFGKNKDRIPWNKFNPLFPNMANNQNALNQYLIEIKNGIFPRRATEIDDIVK